MSELNRKPLSGEELDTLTGLLGRLEPGFQRVDVFTQLRRIGTSAIFEIVPVRHNLKTNKADVLLTRRPEDDFVKEWRGKLHTAGCNIQPTDEEGTDFRNAKNRLLHGELDSVMIDEPVFVTNLLHKVEAGLELAQIHYARVLDENPTVGEFYPADELPHDLIPSQLHFIPYAVGQFCKDFGVVPPTLTS